MATLNVGQNRMIESVFAPTAQEEAEKINAQTGASYVTDQAFWEKQGIITGEQLAVSVLNQTYSDLYKDLHGFRPKHKSFVSVAEAQKAIDALDDAYNTMIEMERMDAETQSKYEAERAELEALMPGEFDFEKYPVQSGMGRRMENRLRLTVNDLEIIINEALDNRSYEGMLSRDHVDGHPWSGTLQDLADQQGRTFGGGSLDDPKGWDASIKLGGKFTAGTAKSPLKMTEKKIRSIVRTILEQQMEQMPLPMHGAEPLAGKGDDDYYKAVRTPEAVASFKSAGFTSDGRLINRSNGLGPLEWGMYTPKNQSEVEAAIAAAIETNQALAKADAALDKGEYSSGNMAWYEIISPVQDKHGKTGIADSEGRNAAADWLEAQGHYWD